ncbi:hypothetical protein [Alteromonas sp. M12]|uniref:hypothetical protein n=1 Tax=Alteromonas sp. M12 TaxID=3135644 RepID=UPI00319DE8AD
MKIKRLATCVLLLCLAACQPTSPTQTVNYEAQGNLQSSTALGCVGIDDVNSSHTPADLFLGLTECIEQDEFDKASDLYLVAMSYGYFDTRRVADRSGHQAIMVLRMNSFGDQEQQTLNELLTYIMQKTSNNSATCKHLKKLGKPTYIPTYMIQHGIGSFTEQKHSNGLIEDFDADTAWQEARSVVANCS